MAAKAMNITGMIAPVSRQSVAGITPEFYFQKVIDNSRLVRMADPKRQREIRAFSAVLSVFFLMAMFYAWQHFRSLQYGYQIESEKSAHDQLVEQNRALTLEQSSLRNPERIASLARQMNLEPPHPGQVLRLDPDASNNDGPEMAEVSTAVIPAQ